MGNKLSWLELPSIWPTIRYGYEVQLHSRKEIRIWLRLCGQREFLKTKFDVQARVC